MLTLTTLGGSRRVFGRVSCAAAVAAVFAFAAACNSGPTADEASAAALRSAASNDTTPWTRAGATLLPRGLHTMAYDEARGNLLLFGGADSAGLGETFLGNGDAKGWSQTKPATAAAPPTRYIGHAMAYDAGRQQVVLFGGKDDSGESLDDTWLWDGQSWTQAFPDNTPPARLAHAMAYDAARKQVVLFGGYDKGLLNDTWTWDGTTWTQGAWLPIEDSRLGHTLAYDAAHEQVVLFGGTDLNSYLGDTWTWDGKAWTQASPSASPPGRQNHAMTYDSANQRVVVFGGYGGSDDKNPGRLDDTWTWDGTTWTEAKSDTSPRPRFDHTMAFDAKTGNVVLFSGNSEQGWLNDLWNWDGSSWKETLAPSAPPPRYRAQSMVYDAGRDKVVVFGGFGPASGWMNDTWSWDRQSWTEVTPKTSPSLRFGHAMIYDGAQDEVVLFGGFGEADELSDTWGWDGKTWTEKSPRATPPGRDGHAMAYDEKNEVGVLFGGRGAAGVLADTWTWDGKAWAQAAVSPSRDPNATPQARQAHALAYDEKNAQVVLFGGKNAAGAALKDTWTWDGQSWTAMSVQKSPPPRSGHAMVYVAAIGQTVLFGGVGDGGENATALDDTWAWDGKAWTELHPSAAPAARYGHAISVDSKDGRVILFGGEGAGPLPELNDTWVWDAGGR